MILQKNGKIKGWRKRPTHLKSTKKVDFEKLVRLAGLNLENVVESPNRGSHLARFIVAEYYSQNSGGFKQDCKLFKICSP